MSYTSFDILQKSILKLGARPVVAHLNKDLIHAGLYIDNPEQVVGCDSGIYYVDPAGVIAKVVLHIVDKKVDDKYSKGLDFFVKKGFFDHENVIKTVHKYHLIKCQIIKKAELAGWKDKYKMSRRLSGRFYYRFIEGNKILKVNEHQILQPCMYCINEINRLPNANFNFTRNSFNLKLFFDHASYKYKSLQKAPLACHSVPNLYQLDWNKISSSYKKLKKYHCEGENCPSPNLSNNKHFLHSHHVNMNKSNNGYSNLKALCLYCHANQPNHEHMKSTPEYKEYLLTIQYDERS